MLEEDLNFLLAQLPSRTQGDLATVVTKFSGEVAAVNAVMFTEALFGVKSEGSKHRSLSSELLQVSTVSPGRSPPPVVSCSSISSSFLVFTYSR